MEFKQIQDLLKFINKSDLTDVEIEQGDFKIRVQRKSPENVILSGVAPTMVQPQPIQQVQQAPQPVQDAAPAKESPAAGKQEEPKGDNLYTFTSPIIGTFYRSANPESDPFVKVGDSVSPNQVLCIIEAMKLFNEIECDVEGKIVKVLVENAQPVEYEQPLFLIERA